RSLRIFLGVLDTVVGACTWGRNHDIAHPDRVAGELAHDDVANLLRLNRATFDAQREVLGTHLHLTAGDTDIARRDRALDLERGHAGGSQPDRVQMDIDLPILTTEDDNLADAFEPFDALADLL